MSIFITSHAWKNSASSGSTLLVLLAVSDFADDNGVAYPAVTTLAKKARASERTVQYALRELIEMGELAISRGEGPKGCNLYRVLISGMKGADFAGGANSAGVQPGSFGGATRCTQTTIEPSEKKENAGAKKKRAVTAEPTFDPAIGKFDGITPQTMALWKAAHPGVDVETELVRASCWLIANPERNPTSRYMRFLTGWLTRAGKRPENRTGAALASPRAMSAKERSREEWAAYMNEASEHIRAADQAADQQHQRQADDPNTFDA